jgi:bifunctional UDP-N-acetylglucosamine pyrophosphorylase / glucosamine-1-phosphate N-acetyltransferase
VFPSFYCLKSQELLHAVSKLNNNNKKGEYYLTDIFGILKREGKKVAAVQAVAPEDTLGVNTRQQLSEIDLIMQDRIQRQLRDSGVTIVNSQNTYIEAGVTIGHESVIEPFTFIGRDSAIGSHCVIGPFARLPRNSVVPDKMTIIGNPPTEAGVKL